MTNKDLENKFDIQNVDSEQTLAIQQKNDLFKKLATTLDLILPDGREKSLVFTKLQEASMWADESIIHTSKK